uniref:Heparan-alpha-glucosaminide N-acetyltransferase catalytic domain-containing protein n=1 Tax=Glossina palpalis gambiensis TaxID=67801 RepID=A0A1B0BY02_9MUSC
MLEFVEYTTPEWRGLNMRSLKVDEAYLILKSHFSKATYLYSLSEACYSCPYTKVKNLLQHHYNDNLTLNVAYPIKFKLIDQDVGRYAFNNITSLCEYENLNYGEFGVYNLTLDVNGSCEWRTDKEAVNIYYPILAVLILLALIMVMLKIGLCAWRNFHYEEILSTVNLSGININTAGQCNRLRSLDTFRGLTIVLMIFVNNGGGHYWWIEHAPWNGLHLADIVFPSFLWIMGVCIPISIKSQITRDVTKYRIVLRILWRSLKLFSIGLCLNSINGPKLENLRIMGVLQRLGVAYLICGLTHTKLSERVIIESQITWKRKFQDLIIMRGELLIVVFLIAVYLCTIFGLNVPQCPRGYLGPGGKHSNAEYFNCIGGASGYIDFLILGNRHIYQNPTARYIYDSRPFDPEGVFGCLLTIVQVFFGLLAGVIILTYTTWRARSSRWLIWSAILALIGGALSGFSFENGFIPINKNLWSFSFVCVTTALSFISLSLLYYVIDVKCWWQGYPFEAAGMNAIILYVGHTVLHKMLPWHWSIGPMNTHFVLLLKSVWNTTLWLCTALYLNYKKFYFRL